MNSEYSELPQSLPSSDPYPAPALLLAAGRGERMRPLTDTTPKPLLSVLGKPLMQWPMEALARAGVQRLVVNTAWLGSQIAQCFGSIFTLNSPWNERGQLSIKERHSLRIHYSHEGQDFGAALETAGGIARALPLLFPPSVADSGAGSDVFWAAAGDVFAPDFSFPSSAVTRFIASGKLAHLWLVPNPAHNPRGDFGWEPEPGSADGMGMALSLPPDDPRPRYTFSTIGLYRSALFATPWCDIPAGNPTGIKAALAPLLRRAMAHGQVSAEIYTGRWIDVGTPERLAQLNASASIDHPPTA
ncbi:MAG: nucleotidyltransferase family protein [Rhodoferax sp.]|nr:nucleotidyltransferase family protein [Rhodoferax sp.]